MLARTRRFILAVALRLVAPAVDACPLLAGHVVAPARVRHVDLRCAFGHDGVVEPDVAEAFLRSGVGDVRARFLCGARGGGDQDSCLAVGGEEARQRGSCWAGADDEVGCFYDGTWWCF